MARVRTLPAVSCAFHVNESLRQHIIQRYLLRLQCTRAWQLAQMDDSVRAYDQHVE